jgi:hypothetical protein
VNEEIELRGTQLEHLLRTADDRESMPLAEIRQ